MRAKPLKAQDWADLVRACALRLECDGACMGMAFIFSLVWLERVYRESLDPLTIDPDHLLILMYLGADALERP